MDMTFGHGVFDSFGAETQVFNWEWGGITICLDDKEKDTFEHINEDGNDKFRILEYKACKDRSNPERAEDEHYYRVYHYKSCTEEDGCDAGWLKQEDWTVGNADSHGPTAGFDPTDTDAAATMLTTAKGYAVDKGMAISGCMDSNASNYDESAITDDGSCECNEGYEMGDDGTCQEVVLDDTSTDDTSTDDSSSTSLGDGGPAPEAPKDNSKLLLLGAGLIGAVLLMGGEK